MAKNQFERCQRFLVGHLSSPGSMPQSPFVLTLSRKSSPGARAVGGQELFSEGNLEKRERCFGEMEMEMIRNIREES